MDRLVSAMKLASRPIYLNGDPLVDLEANLIRVSTDLKSRTAVLLATVISWI
jgi:hypothetical protein